MSSPPRLFETTLIAGRLARAAARPVAGADFLLARAGEDLAERLAGVLRPFPRIADVGTPTAHFRQVLQSVKPQSGLTALTPAESAPEVLDSSLQVLGVSSLDLIVSGLALQHANDLPGALVQLRRALAPDGLFIGCMLGGATLTELRQVLTAAESEVTGGVSPRVFPFADVRDMGGLLQRAGFKLPVVDSEPLVVRYPDMVRLIADLRAMAGTNVMLARSRRPTRRAVFARAAELYGERFADGDGRIRATFEMIWLSGWAEHESQQQPLKPGSARQRLADALGLKDGNA
jgi:SAM-dependent methyltransferase